MTKPLVVIASGVMWDGVKGSERHLAESLTWHADILWVDPPSVPVTPARFRGAVGRMWRPALGPCRCPCRRRRRSPGWPVASGLDPARYAVAHLADGQGSDRLGVEEIRPAPAAFVACTQHDLLGRWGRNVVNVLYGTDDWVAGAGLMRQNPRRVLAEERAALTRADLVPSPPMGQSWLSGHRTTWARHRWCSPTDVILRRTFSFRTLKRDRCPMVSRRRSPGWSVSSVTGSTSAFWRLWPTLVSGCSWLARAIRHGHRVGLRYCFPGPTCITSALCRSRNCRGGSPGWMSASLLTPTPHSNRASFPLKTLEYLAAGLPVVSTDLPASQRLREETTQVWVAADRRAFVDAVMDLMGRKWTPEVVEQRRQVAQLNSWSARTNTFLRLTGLEVTKTHVQ